MTIPASLRLNRLIKAPRARVFAAWTTPEDIMQWFSPTPSCMISAQTDPRPGGEYSFRMRTPHLGEIEFRGVYREVTPPKELVFTWSGTCCETPAGEETIVTVEFIDRNGDTEVRLSHEFFPNAELRDKHSAGWTGSLGNLEKLLGL